MKTKISKKIVTSILALLLIPMLVITLLAGCAKQTYTVTVINGTGGGEYEAGETCTVTATVTDGQQFVRWTVDDEEVSTENPYSFEVTQDITVTAVLTDIPAPVDKYTVTVVGGTGGGEYEAGESCTVTATVPDGQQFIRWLVNGEEVSASPSYTFTVTENMTITAVFNDEIVVYLSKSVGGNPIGGFGIGDDTYDRDWSAGDKNTPWEKGDEAYADVYTYAGDPAVMVVEENGVETAYLYVGHDVTPGDTANVYTMPEWLCYSSTDLVNWKAEGVILDIEDVPYANRAYNSAWASQVIEYKGYYWFLFCTYTQSGDSGTDGAQCIGVAVSKSPTGPFECYEKPLVLSQWTNATALGKDAEGAGWNDIDPTAWITSEGEFYVAWGNSNSFLCQVDMVTNDDDTVTTCPYMLKIVDQSESAEGNLVTTDDPTFYWFDETPEDGKTVEEVADIMRINLSDGATANNVFTEAPYIYMREFDDNKDGATDRYRYYMFYAAGWREALAYSYIDVNSEGGLWEAHWKYGNRLMDPTATSNTNHPAVFDFGGKTYMIYHNGMLPYGCGFRRVACIAELEFSDNGFIAFVAENSTGIDGVTSKITQDGIPVGHMYTVNPHEDMYYPLNLPVFRKPASEFENAEDILWEIEAAKYVPAGKDAASYISIQAYNMAGLYLTYDLETGEVYITQDNRSEGSAESDALQQRMSFRTLAGENGEGVMFQCVADTDYYLAVIDGKLIVSDNASLAQRTFRVQTETANRSGIYEANEGAAR